MSSPPGSSDGSQRNSYELDKAHAQKMTAQVKEAEPTQMKLKGVEPPHVKEAEPSQLTLKEAEMAQVKLKERQKYFEEAFQQDMDQYLSTGYLQINERRGSFSSMEVNVDMLEQMDLTDMSDQESFDVFLHSGGEENSAASPILGPEGDSFTTELSLRVPTQAELRHKLSSVSSTCTDNQDTEAGKDDDHNDSKERAGEGGGSQVPVVGAPPYISEVAPNLALAGRPPLQRQPRNQSLKHSDSTTQAT
ncbi:dystrobrevin binding protein 1b isoform X2 [Esox lucius]|nr:dystrobrevin binding protein 1b isoform X2 [Esox lucius]